MRRKVILFVFLALAVIALVSAAYADYPRVVSLPAGGVVSIECDGGNGRLSVTAGIWNTIIVSCPGSK